MQINKSSIKNFRKQLEETLKALGDTLGLDIEVENMYYSNIEINSKIKAKVKLVNRQGYQREDFVENCEKYGLRPEDYEKEVEYLDDDYLIKGFNINDNKYPYMLERISDGNMFKVNKETMIEILENNPIIE